MSQSPAKEPQRIAKLLARAGIASRREVERMIAEGRIAIDGQAIDTPATLLASLHGVTVDGQPVEAPRPARLFVFHKPTGLLVTERDPKGRPTIYDRLPRDLPRVVPVGRLDLNTEGLLLLTTDGALKRQLELPASGVERTYRARAYGEVSQDQLEALIDGVEIDGVHYGAIDANLERRTGANVWIELTLTEGKNREVRRVLEHLGLQVSRLIRTRYGPFVLGDLPAGAVGEVRRHDLVLFRQALDAGKKADMAVAVEPRMAAPAAPPRTVARPGGRAKPGAKRVDAPAADRERPTRAQRQRPSSRSSADAGAQPTDTRRPRHRSADAGAAPEPKSKPKRGAGWAKPKPRPKPPGKPRRPKRP
ncbi:MAG: pseudouridine synthase [Sphingomonas sp.]